MDSKTEVRKLEVEEIARKINNGLAVRLTPSNEAMQACRWVKNEIVQALTTLTTKHQEELEKAVEVALNKGYTKALREIDIGSYDYVKSRRKIAELSGVPMMAITYDEHVDVIREKLQALTPTDYPPNT